jgi:phage terminase large subunit-like protein
MANTPQPADKLALAALQAWAQERISTAEEIVERPWRGKVPWDKPYQEVLREWQEEDPALRPPAFRDGLARPEQLLPGTPGAAGAILASTADPRGRVGQPITDQDSYTYFLLRCGRGFGKSLAGSNAIIEWARQGLSPLLIAGATSTDVRDTMVETGESSIMRVSPPDFRPHYEPSKLRLTFPNGVIAQLRSAEDPERFRGIQFIRGWLDELASWRRLEETWAQIRYIMRVKRGSAPVQLIITATPKPVKVIKDLSRSPRCALIVRPTMDNLANLAGDFREQINEVAGTRMGRQEIEAEILEDVEGAFWKQETIDKCRVEVDILNRLEFERIVVAVDPPGGATEAGIVVAGFVRGCPHQHEHCRGHCYILDDVSLAGPPEVWARRAVDAYHSWQADRLVAETNYGGDMVRHTIATTDDRVAFGEVTASRGKHIRAEPVSNLYEGEHPRVHHVGCFAALESEQTQWTKDTKESPNRLDACVWAVSDLMLGDNDFAISRPYVMSKTANFG